MIGFCAIHARHLVAHWSSNLLKNNALGPLSRISFRRVEVGNAASRCVLHVTSNHPSGSPLNSGTTTTTIGRVDGLDDTGPSAYPWHQPAPSARPHAFLEAIPKGVMPLKKDAMNGIFLEVTLREADESTAQRRARQSAQVFCYARGVFCVTPSKKHPQRHERFAAASVKTLTAKNSWHCSQK